MLVGASVLRLPLEHAGFQVIAFDRVLDGFRCPARLLDGAVVDAALENWDGLVLARPLRGTHANLFPLVVTESGSTRARQHHHLLIESTAAHVDEAALIRRLRIGVALTRELRELEASVRLVNGPHRALVN